jgi:hypothetical protein
MKFLLAIATALIITTAARAEDCHYNGDGSVNVSCPPGSDIRKDGKGTAVIALLEPGGYTGYINGPGPTYLTGRQDYREVKIGKNGPGNLYWVPNDPNKPYFGPTVVPKDGPGQVKPCAWSDVPK